MFETIRALLSGDSLIKKAYDDTFVMMDVVASLYQEATALLLDGTPPTIDIHREDKRINAMEQDIRRDILEHLSVNPGIEVSASLILSAAVGYVERAGDYAKNIEELAGVYGRPLRQTPAAGDLVRAAEMVGEYHVAVRQAFSSEDKEQAAEALKTHKRIRNICDAVVEQAFASDSLDKNDALVFVMYARYLKRITAGMKNVATTVVMPFDRIGYTKIVEPGE